MLTKVENLIRARIRYAAGGDADPEDYSSMMENAHLKQMADLLEKEHPPTINPMTGFPVDYDPSTQQLQDAAKGRSVSPSQVQTQSINPEDTQTFTKRPDVPDIYKNDPDTIYLDPYTLGTGIAPVNIPENMQQAFPSQEALVSNKIPEGYAEAVQEFSPFILNTATNVDRSFDILYYLGLGGLGGKTVLWQLGREFLTPEEKQKLDMNDKHHHCYCDGNHGQDFLIEDLLNNAMSAGHNAPMFTQAGHPNCQCSLIFNKNENFPNGYKDIPDTCPSMPKTNDVALKDKRRQEIFAAIPETFVFQYSTATPLYITNKTASTNVRTVYADASSIQMNRPIRVNQNCIAVKDWGFWQPIPEGSFGIVLNVNGPYAEIYYIDFLCKVKIKKSNINILDNLKEASSTELNKKVYFIMSEGRLGALAYNRSGKFNAYFPDTDQIEEINDVTILTM